MKILIKRLYHHVAIEQIDVNLWERSKIIKLISLVHNQLSSPVFKEMIQYSQFCSGYTNVNPSISFSKRSSSLLSSNCFHRTMTRETMY
jgi:hypothetical protein